MLSALIRFNLRTLLNPPPHKSLSSLHIADSSDKPRKVHSLSGWCLMDGHFETLLSLLRCQRGSCIFLGSLSGVRFCCRVLEVPNIWNTPLCFGSSVRYVAS